MTPLWNLGHEQFVKLFWDGRVQVDPSFPQGFASPAGADLPFGFEFALDALSIFAQTDLQEMTGQPGTNELADASLIHPQIGVWDGLVARLGAIPEYVDLFMLAFPLEVALPGDISIVHVGKAIGAFQADAFRADDSPFDRYLRGDKKAMNKNAVRGMKLFYGKAECSNCHSGVFQTDHDFHAIGIPQIGPGFDLPRTSVARASAGTRSTAIASALLRCATSFLPARGGTTASSTLLRMSFAITWTR